MVKSCLWDKIRLHVCFVLYIFG